MRNVARGVYVGGARAGQPCVIKWFRTGLRSSRTFFARDIHAVQKALDIIDAWNTKRFVSVYIRLNLPKVFRLDKSYGRLEGSTVLVEPYIHNFGKCTSIRPSRALTREYSVLTMWRVQGIRILGGPTVPRPGDV